MKIKHKGSSKPPRSATLSPEYAAEVEKHTAKAERLYAKALKVQRDLEAHLLAKQSIEAQEDNFDISRKRRRDHKRMVAILDKEIAQRREELRQLHQMMRSAPASQVHRGRKQHRPPVPPPGEIV